MPRSYVHGRSSTPRRIVHRIVQPTASRRRDWCLLASALVGAAVVSIAYWRLFYGVDFTDESYYIEVPLRFVMGARPYVDETTPSQQGAGLLLYPFVAAYHAVAGVDGIILFGRHLYFVFSCAVAACVYLGLRPFSSTRAEAALPSLVPVAFVPFSLPSPSYNTLGSGLLVAGLFLGLRFLATHQWANAAAAGLAHGLAFFAYPPLLAPAVAFLAALVWLARDERKRVALAYGLPALLPVAALGAVVANAGVDNVRAVYSNAQTFGGQAGGVGKVLFLIRGLLRLALIPPFWVLAVLGLAAASHRRRTIAYALAALLPLIALIGHDPRQPSASMQFVTIYGLCALPLTLISNETTVFLAVWPAAFVAGLATAWTSNNGANSFGLGFAAAPIVTTFLLTRIFARSGWVAAFAASALTLTILTVLQFTYVYRDDSFGALGTRISAGPYAGISTTPARARFVEGVRSDLRRFSGPTCTILFYDAFPAGYLLGPSEPDTNAVFLLQVRRATLARYRNVLLRYYRERADYPEVVVRMTAVPGVASYALPAAAQDPLDRLVRRSHEYVLAARRAAYSIYARPHARCRAG